ncbi:hypothetical protein U1Q18_021918 [Sarracenia purpurea var. burkii]
MHAIKGGWIGHPFALAKCNESGGKKSRVRRSKEERKAMVESFIKKYQKLNNGNFPSLNLAHKEVGGSFYTVREIVREVIQENRVLGPAKFTLEEQSPNTFLEQYPLGSISIEPETDLLSSNEAHLVRPILPNHHQDASEELVLNSSVHCPEADHWKYDGGQIINGSTQAVEKNEEYDKAIYTESQARENLEREENVAKLEASKAKVTHVAADVMVETFPLVSGSRTTYGFDGKSSESSELIGTLVEKEIEFEKVEMEADNTSSGEDGMIFLECSADFENDKAEAIFAGPLLGKSCCLVDEKPVGNIEAPLLQKFNDSSTKESTILDTGDGDDPVVNHSLPAGTKAIDVPDGIHSQSIDGTVTSSSHEKSISTKGMASIPDFEPCGNSSMKGSNPTLDRMNIESWETTPQTSAKPETNPLLAFFKAFIAAFVKFWSE